MEFFAPHPDVPGDAKKGLRVSRYLGDEDTPPQFRFSIWSGEAADAAVSLDDGEAARLGAFVSPQRAHRRPLANLVRLSRTRFDG